MPPLSPQTAQEDVIKTTSCATRDGTMTIQGPRCKHTYKAKWKKYHPGIYIYINIHIYIAIAIKKTFTRNVMHLTKQWNDIYNTFRKSSIYGIILSLSQFLHVCSIRGLSSDWGICRCPFMSIITLLIKFESIFHSKSPPPPLLNTNLGIKSCALI